MCFGISSGPIIKNAMDTLKVFFNLIDEKLRQGVPGNKCMNISTDCRLETINAAYTMQPLPECAGGPVEATLTVVGVEAKSLVGGTVVEVTFNEAVDPATAQVIGNYSFDPPVQANSARVDTTNPSLVRLGVALHEPGDYTLCVLDVLSAKAEPLVQGSNCGNFTFKAESAS